MPKSKPYNEKNDDPQDKKMTRGFSAEERKEYKKMDTAHGKKKKPKTMAEDNIADKKIRKEILEERKEKKTSKRSKADHDGDVMKNMTPRQMLEYKKKKK